jgi:phospholipid-binding lipoprotein MlaA
MKLDTRTALRGFVVAAALLALGGCASVRAPHPNDPWEPMNRGITEFNEGLDAALLKPAATVYREKVPALARTGVSNFFGNLGDAWSFVNSVLQGKMHDAADNFARLQLNTVWGVFGIFDVASEFNIERHREDFGQTLGRWGVGSGPYLVLPFFGPSTLRDAVALPIDRRADFARRIDPGSVRNSTYVLRAVNQRANLLRVGDMLDEAALDKYSFTRDAHLQRRRAEIYEIDDPRRDIPPPLPPGEAPAGITPAGQPTPAPAR